MFLETAGNDQMEGGGNEGFVKLHHQTQLNLLPLHSQHSILVATKPVSCVASYRIRFEFERAVSHIRAP
jgi:hypothetical protein